MQHQITLFFLCLFGFNIGFSQASVFDPYSRQMDQTEMNIKIIGKVVDGQSEQGLEFATISLFDLDSVLIGGALTNTNGDFSIETKLQDLYIIIEFIGYQALTLSDIQFNAEEIRKANRTKDLGMIKIFASGIELDGVEVRAEKSETQFSLDKRIFNVGKDLANKGGTAEDILDNVPSISVDLEGEVTLRGNAGVRILIDGRPSNLASTANTNSLKQIPASMIESIEVITNPSARYEAESVAGIINIILKKEKRSGFNGAFDLSAGYPESGGLGASLNYRKGKINWFANYGLNYRNSPGSGANFQRITLNDTTYITDQYRTSNRSSLSNNIRFGIDYFITEKQSITGAFLYKISNQDNITTQEYNDYINEFPDNYIGLTTRTDNGGEAENSLQYSINYNREFSSREHKLSGSVQFENNSEIEDNLYDEVFEPSEGTINSILDQRSNNEEGQSRLLLQMDYVHPLGDGHQYEFGLRSSFRTISNHYLVEELIGMNWENLVGLSNDFNYDEDIHAVYGQYGNKYGKFSFQTGLRVEYSDVTTKLVQTNKENQRDYFDFFPSAFLNYEFSEANAMQISYSRRVRRPRFRTLNPFFTYSDSRNFYSGNPDLDPEYTHSFDLNYLRFWEKATFTTGVFYRHSTGVIERIKTVFPDGSTATRPENLATRDDYGLELILSYTALKWLRLDGNVNIFRSQTDGTNVGSTFQSDTYTWNSRLTSKFTFWQGSDLQIRANYRAPRERTQGVLNLSQALI